MVYQIRALLNYLAYVGVANESIVDIVYIGNVILKMDEGVSFYTQWCFQTGFLCMNFLPVL